MKIARYLYDGQVSYGIIENEQLYPCGDPFINPAKETRAMDLFSVKLLAPVSPPNIICIGLNYRKHADETGLPYPAEPLIFIKTTTTVCGPGDSVVLPSHSPDQIDYEAELAIVIGKTAKNISEAEVADYVLGYTIANDISDRAVQFSDVQWSRAKSYDTFCPLGPFIVTDLNCDSVNIMCRLNGRVMQASNTSDMIFSCRQIVSYLSRCMTLLPGTVILTGTPEGVGFKRNPPVFLRKGQVLETEIEGIGVLSNPVAGHEHS
jgi:2-keto-4-pentenoate hydratase/2-oxohepta-3-ene-1,7-dioic acid hydratase in catechol pathway